MERERQTPWKDTEFWIRKPNSDQIGTGHRLDALILLGIAIAGCCIVGPICGYILCKVLGI